MLGRFAYRRRRQLVPVLARAVDRKHSLDLLKAEVDLEVRETFESAMVLGAAALEKLGSPPDEVAEISDRIRKRDQKRLQLEVVGGICAGRELFSGKPKGAGEFGNDEV